MSTTLPQTDNQHCSAHPANCVGRAASAMTAGGNSNAPSAGVVYLCSCCSKWRAVPRGRNRRPQVSDFEQPGPHAVGHVLFELTDAGRVRTLQVTAWYPAEKTAATAETSISELLAAGTNRNTYAALLGAAPTACPTRLLHSTPNAAPAATGALPLLVFSHSGSRGWPAPRPARPACSGFALANLR